MNKDLELLEEIKKAPAFMGGNPRYSNNLQSSIPFLEDIAVIEKALEQLEMYRDFTIPNLKKTILIASKIIEGQQVSKEELDDYNEIVNQVKSCYVNEDKIKQALLKAEKQEKALAIIKEKLVNVSILRSARNLKDYNNFGAPNVIDALKLTQEEFDLLREVFWK